MRHEPMILNAVGQSRARCSWHAGAMTGTRLAFITSLGLLIAACLLPCGTFAEWSGTSLPYQDPTPEMLQKQAEETAALEDALFVRLSISAALGLASLGAFGYGLRRWRGHRRSAGQDQTHDGH